MDLLKTEYSDNKGIGKLDKVLLKCEESNYYKLTEILYTSHNEQVLILRALYELPNFIRYFCVIRCNDNIKNIINNQNTISNYKMCHYGDNEVGILIMKEYNLGCIENYVWNEQNIHLLKNVIKQVIFSILLAYEKKDFIHGDLHCGNVLLKPKRNCEIKYNNKILVLNELEVIIMDFEKSKLYQNNKITELIKNISKFITSISSTCLKNDLFFNIDLKKIYKLKSIIDINIDYYNELEKIIDEVIIEY